MPKVFISYRRTDSASVSGRIYDRLAVRFGGENIFKDVDTIPAGARFSDFIEDSLRQCVLLLVIIGPDWITASTDDGNRRLDDPQDWVRLEVEMGFALGLTVLPVLVEGTRLPTRAALPASLSELSVIQAVEVRNDPDFSRDIERLVKVLERVFAAQLEGLPSTSAVREDGTASAHAVTSGGRWEIVPSRTSEMLLSVAMVSDSDGWAVGTGGVMLRLMDGQWQLISPSPTAQDLTNIVMVSASDGWAVGNGQTILRFTGHKWENPYRYSYFPSPANLTGVAMTSAIDVWTVGRSHASFSSAMWTILHLDGRTWKSMYNLAPQKRFFGMGSRQPRANNLSSVTMVSPREGWAVGTKGTILHYVEGEWHKVESPTQNQLTCVAMIAASEGWAVGEKGAILHYKGRQWHIMASPTTEYLTSVMMVAAHEGWAVGERGTILHYAGGEWVTAGSPTSNDLYGVAMISSSEGWAVGNKGTMLHYTTGSEGNA